MHAPQHIQMQQHGGDMHKKHKRSGGGGGGGGTGTAGQYLTDQRSFSSSEEELRSTPEFEGEWRWRMASFSFSFYFDKNWLLYSFVRSDTKRPNYSLTPTYLHNLPRPEYHFDEMNDEISCRNKTTVSTISISPVFFFANNWWPCLSWWNGTFPTVYVYYLFWFPVHVPQPIRHFVNNNIYLVRESLANWIHISESKKGITNGICHFVIARIVKEINTFFCHTISRRNPLTNCDRIMSYITNPIK